jgi:hypothetical protein
MLIQKQGGMDENLLENGKDKQNLEKKQETRKINDPITAFTHDTNTKGIRDIHICNNHTSILT